MDHEADARLKASLSDPTAVYRSPEEVERDASLSSEEKLAILVRWEQDARELAVAEDENMAGGEPSRLGEVVAARARLAGSIGTGSAKERAAADPSNVRVHQLARPVPEIVHADREIDEADLKRSLQDCAFLAVADGDEIVGMLTHADLAQAQEARTVEATRVTARMIMTPDLAYCFAEDDAATARALMARHKCQHLFVIEPDGALVGIVGCADLASARSDAAPEGAGARGKAKGGVAATMQPGGLEVYADRPRIRFAPQD